MKVDQKGKGIKEGEEPGYPAPIKRKENEYHPCRPLPYVRQSPLYQSMEPGHDKKRIQKFFDYASLTSVAWELTRLEDPTVREEILFVGKLLRELMLNKYLDQEVLQFYTHRRCTTISRDSFRHPDDQKYIRYEIMSPIACYYMKNNIISEVQKLVVDFIRDMPDNLEVFVIPVNHSTVQMTAGIHWSLLKFDFEAREWKWYNTLHSNEGYKEDAQKLANALQLELNKKRALKGDAPIEPHEINVMSCPAQESNPDCLLYTSYFMKQSVKKIKSIERDQQRAKDICQEMRTKLVAKMLKKVVVYEKVWDIAKDIAKDEQHKEWRLSMEMKPLKSKKSF